MESPHAIPGRAELNERSVHTQKLRYCSSGMLGEETVEVRSLTERAWCSVHLGSTSVDIYSSAPI